MEGLETLNCDCARDASPTASPANKNAIHPPRYSILFSSSEVLTMGLFLGNAWIPLFTGLVFLGGLIAMLATWAAEGYPRYKPNEGSIVYVSDIGAHLKPLFISTCVIYTVLRLAICAITAPGFVLSEVVDRFRRHRGRLGPDHLKLEKWMSWFHDERNG